MREATEVADLGQEPERGERANAAKRAQPAYGVAPRLAGRDRFELVVDRGELGSIASRWERMWQKAVWASGSARRWRESQAACCLVHAFLPSR